MRIDYPDNSFMLGFERCRAWFNPDGTLKDAEYKRRDRHGGPTATAVPLRHTKVRAWLNKRGAQEADLLSRGVLKRATTIQQFNPNNTMYQLKPYQLVEVKRTIDGIEYISTGQTMSYPTPTNTIMVRLVPGHPETLQELKVDQIEPLRSQTRRRWVHYARVKRIAGNESTGFPTDMLRRENAVAVTFDAFAENVFLGARTEEAFLIAKVGEKSKPTWNHERWLSFGWSLEEGHSERATPEMQ